MAVSSFTLSSHWVTAQCEIAQRVTTELLGDSEEDELSNEKNRGCLGCIGDYTTQLDGDFHKPI